MGHDTHSPVLPPPPRSAWRELVALRLRWQRIARVSKWAACVVGTLVLMSARSQPTLPAVAQVYTLVQNFGMLGVLFMPALVMLGKSASAADKLGDATRSFLAGLWAYAMVLWLMGIEGDALYTSVQANPERATVIAVTAALVLLIQTTGFRLGLETHAAEDEEIPPHNTLRPTGEPSGPKAQPTARDLPYIAAHEAAHALVYAALDRLPDDMRLVISDGAADGAPLGYVTGVVSPHQLEERTFAQWSMLVFLAGKLGEARLRGESTLGSASDHARWLRVACSYLSSHYDGIFYREPQSDLELVSNERKLYDLQDHQLRQLKQFFEINHEVLKDLAQTLLAQRTVQREQLMTFLERVTLPEGFPRPALP